MSLKPPGINLPDQYGRVTVGMTADRSIPNSSETTLIFDQETVDTDGLVDLATYPTRAITASQAGRVLVTANVSFVGNAAGGRFLYLYKSGALVAGSTTPSFGASLYTLLTVSCQIDIAAGDYVEATVYQSSGGGLVAMGSSSGFGANYGAKVRVTYL